MENSSDSSTVVSGGKAVYGARLGILMLEAKFPRIPGDMGNALTWPFPVFYKVVRGASPTRVVVQADRDLLPAFIDAGQELVASGVDGLTTNCGFLAIFQAELSAACSVPVASSALLQSESIQRLLPPDQRVGIITISKASLSGAHLTAAGVALDCPIVGTDNGCEFSRVILNNEIRLDVSKARRDLLDAASELITSHPEVGAILLECTNMAPYSRDIQNATGRPVFDIVTMIHWFYSSLAPRRFDAPG